MKRLSLRGLAALVFTCTPLAVGCPGTPTCTTDSDCTDGNVCDTDTGSCVSSSGDGDGDTVGDGDGDGDTVGDGDGDGDADAGTGTDAGDGDGDGDGGVPTDGGGGVDGGGVDGGGVDGGDGDGGVGDGGVVTDGGLVNACDDYCATMLTNCSQTYADEAECQAACAQFDATGTDGDVDGNTLQCRAYHAGTAVDNDAHCGHAAADSTLHCNDAGKLCADLLSGNCADLVSAEGWADQAACEAEMLGLGVDVGTAGDVDGNSLQCRAYHAAVAAGDVENSAHCGHAAPDSTLHCNDAGQLCADLLSGNCADLVTAEGWTNQADCEAEMLGLGVPLGTAGDIDGDTLACRAYHASVAAGDVENSGHCGHAAPESTLHCNAVGPICADMLSGNCEDVVTGHSWDGQGACEADYLALTTPWDGFDGAVYGDSYACRAYHAGAAAGDVANSDHCGHADLAPSDFCIDDCANYCAMVDDNCNGQDKVFNNTAQCLAACGAYATDGAPGDSIGDTLQCRMYHADAARFLDDAATHCPHAGEDGGGVCVN